MLILLLLIPIDLEGRVARGGVCPETRMRIGWLFGRLSKDVFSVAEREPSEKGEDRDPEREDKEGGEAERGLGSARVILEVLKTDGFLGTLSHLFRGLLGAIQVQPLKIDIAIGLSDPADTGEALGLLWAALSPIEALTPVRSKIEPAFSEERLEGSFEGRLRIVPLKIIPPLAHFILSPPAWRAGLRAIRARRGKR
ncbi:MAG: DUF2953 domain-containing protein [Methanocrinis sp.]